MRFGRLHFALVALVVVATTAPALADQPRRVGIVIATAVNTTPDEADALAEALGASLAAALPVDVIAGRETRRRLPPEGLPEECVAKAECRQDLGRRLDAAELLMLVVVRIGERVQIDATWANVASGNVTSRPAVVLEPGSERDEVFAAAAPKLLPHIKAAPERTGPDVVVVTGGGTIAPDDGRHMTRNAWIATGVAAGAFVGGSVFALSARSKHDALDADGCRSMPCDQDRVDALRRHSLAADALYAVAIGAGVTAVVMYVRSGGERTAPPAETPLVTVGGDGSSFGISVGGRF